VNDTGRQTDVVMAETLDAEMGLIREAILLVASGGSSRVILSGLSFGEALLQPARLLASEHDVLIEPRFSTDEVGASVVVVPGSTSG
jgi:hypothetical protein